MDIKGRLAAPLAGTVQEIKETIVAAVGRHLKALGLWEAKPMERPENGIRKVFHGILKTCGKKKRIFSKGGSGHGWHHHHRQTSGLHIV